MANRSLVVLDAPARTTLCELRDHGPKAYLRERAAVVLAVADGSSLREAAAHAGLKPRHVETVWNWVTRYRLRGLRGLWIGKGRGRKPACFPVGARRRA